MKENQNNSEFVEDNSNYEKEFNRVKISDSFEKPYPFITLIISLICIFIYLALNINENLINNDYFKIIFNLNIREILLGNLWGLITTNIIHIEIWHILLNIYIFLLLGSKVEKEIRKFKYLALFFSSSIICSSIELLINDEIGIGISSIVYSFIGVIFICSSSLSSFKHVLSKRDYFFFLGWVIICCLINISEIANLDYIGNIVGFLWGINFSYLYIIKNKNISNYLIQSCFIFLSILPFVYAPWSINWLHNELAKNIHEGKFEESEYYMLKILKKDPNDFLATSTMGFLYEINKDLKKSEEYLKKAKAMNLGTDLIDGRLIEVLINENKLEEGQLLLNEYLSKKPNDPVLISKQAYINLKKRNYKDSILNYKKVIEINDLETKSIAYYNISCAYSLSNNKSEAIKNIKIAINLNKKFKNDIKTDPDLENLKTEKEFQDLLK